MTTAFPYATNPTGVQVAPFELDAPDAPDTQTYHGFFIVANGKTVGRLQEWEAQHYQRTGTHVFELNARTSGHPVDYVPGYMPNFKAQFVHAEVWGAEVERKFGFTITFADLSDQRRPFTLEEWVLRGGSPYKIWQYRGCWFEDKNRQRYTVNGDYMIKTSGTIAFVNVIQVL